MKSEHLPKFLMTVADTAQFDGLFNGPFMKGHRERRIAMVGRSNVGKSSLINALLKTTLARTSGQPGKTRALHFYSWPESKRIIVDLPGYGYAHASKTDRLKWEKFIEAYFQNETNLDRALVLLDARHGPTKNDEEAIEFLSLLNIPVTFVFVKIDTLKTQSLRSSRQKETKAALEVLGVGMKDVFWVSSQTGAGLSELKRELKHDSEEREDKEDTENTDEA